MKKQEQIEDAVVDIILSEGAFAVSTVKVAKKVGISQSNVYLYFKNRDDMLMSVYQRQIKRIQSRVDFKQLGDVSIPIETRVKMYVRSVYDFSKENPQGLTVIQQIKFLMGQVDFGPAIDFVKLNEVVPKLIKEAARQRLIKPMPASVLMAMVFAVISTNINNVKKGEYSKDQYSFEDLFALVW